MATIFLNIFSNNKLLLVCFLLLHIGAYAQETTYNPGEKEREEQSKTRHRMLLVPYNPKMYMSRIDHKINEQTKYTQKQINQIIRFGLNNELNNACKRYFKSFDLLSDTAKYNKEIQGIYGNIGYSYDKIPDQSQYQAPKSEKPKSGVKNGQIVTEVNRDARFMNTKVKNPALIPDLYKKHQTDLFLFINQIDILASSSESPEFRKIIIHYTAYTVDAREINSGTCQVLFPITENDPHKIVKNYLSSAAKEIMRRIFLQLYPAEKAKEKEKPKK